MEWDEGKTLPLAAQPIALLHGQRSGLQYRATPERMEEIWQERLRAQEYDGRIPKWPQGIWRAQEVTPL